MAIPDSNTLNPFQLSQIMRITGGSASSGGSKLDDAFDNAFDELDNFSRELDFNNAQFQELDSQMVEQFETSIGDFQSTLESEREALIDATDPETITGPLKEAFEATSANVEQFALTESRRLTEDLQAFEQASSDPRLAARAATTSRATNDLQNNILNASSNNLRAFGEQMTQALLGAGELRLNASNIITQGAGQLASMIADFGTTRQGLWTQRLGDVEQALGQMTSLAVGISETQASVAASIASSKNSFKAAQIQARTQLAGAYLDFNQANPPPPKPITFHVSGLGGNIYR